MVESFDKLNLGDILFEVLNEFSEPFILATGGGGSLYGGKIRLCGTFGSGGSLYKGGIFLQFVVED